MAVEFLMSRKIIRELDLIKLAVMVVEFPRREKLFAS